jgi:uncharacterized DUF497 family protein
MEFEWDERKNKANIRKHGFSFRIVPEIFKGPCVRPFFPDQIESRSDSI